MFVLVSIDDIESGSLLFAALYIKYLVDVYIDHPILIVLTENRGSVCAM